MAEERIPGTPNTGFSENNTVDIQHRLPAPSYSEETSAEVAAPSYSEETSAEIAAPRPVTLNRGRTQGEENTAEKGVGWAALALSILSLFVLPVLFGAAGIILGFVARSKGATGLGSWAIGIGAISIILGMFILPFF